MLAISFHLKNQYHRSPTVTRLIIVSSQTHSHKGIPLKPKTSLIHNVYLKLVKLIIANRFLIKIEKIQWNTHTLHIYFSLETQTRKTNNMFRVTPIIVYSSYSSFFTIKYTYMSHDMQTPNPLTWITQQP
jgi:hypothetical protein